jgi:hypothetical protein
MPADIAYTFSFWGERAGVVSHRQVLLVDGVSLSLT